MVPVIELRGAIPIGVGLGMSPLAALGVSIVGNLVPVPFIILFIRKIFRWMRRHMPRLEKLVSRMEEKAEKHKDLVTKWEFLGLLILVAIPLPGTGAWTGALVAALMDLRLKKSFPAIFTGVVIAGLIVTGITYGFVNLFS
ncbi:MAG: small multi-drug export protein [Oscillospiraceae bacterium]|nr:small multi-drug export protein [Oscillospiraceae bacterium]